MLTRRSTGVLAACAVVALGLLVALVGVGAARSPAEGRTPSSVRDLAVAYDTATGSVVAFGGSDAQGDALGTTWAFSGGHWRRLHLAARPPARWGAQLAYDPELHGVVLVGGTDVVNGSAHPTTTAWVLLNGGWHRLGADSARRFSQVSAMAYDPTCGALVRYGPTGTYELVGTTWTPLVSRGPALVTTAFMTYDPHIGLVLAGLTNETNHRRMWRLTGSSWQPIGALPRHATIIGFTKGRLVTVEDRGTGLLGAVNVQLAAYRAGRWQTVGRSFDERTTWTGMVTTPRRVLFIGGRNDTTWSFSGRRWEKLGALSAEVG